MTVLETTENIVNLVWFHQKKIECAWKPDKDFVIIFDDPKAGTEN